MLINIIYHFHNHKPDKKLSSLSHYDEVVSLSVSPKGMTLTLTPSRPLLRNLGFEAHPTRITPPSWNLGVTLGK